MLASLVAESKARKAALAVENDARKKEAIASVEAATSASMDLINSGVAKVWHNQQQLEAEARALHAQADTFHQQSAQWAAAFAGFHQSLKALGDVENWAKTIEADMLFVNASLEQIQQAQVEAAAAAPRDESPAAERR
ncbi:hypothetical protein AB1Y20_007394 [Prymnesium parvum]|uniref:Biogenesis of lysosome-related organelles complex 1 subunit 1 n=1 Tax=Prymnesium parvum TaxID=97485 RepID=A0AB34IXQ3_PRYPA